MKAFVIRKSVYRLLSLLALSFLASVVSAQDFLPVEEAFDLEVLVEEGEVQARWTIEPGYYLYRDRLSLKSEDESVRLGKVSFSKPGKQVDDPTFGEQRVFYDEVTLFAPLSAEASSASLAVSFQGCAVDGICYPPETRQVELDVSPSSSSAESLPTANKATSANREAIREESGGFSGLTNASASGLSAFLGDANTFVVLAVFLILGIGLSFTPCVLPMVPILSGIIVGQSERPSALRGFSLSLAYVLGMAATYALLGTLVGHFGARANVQIWMQHPAVLTSFGLLFVVLALAMFGVYELRLPSGLNQRLMRLSEGQSGGQLAGVTLMGALSALVVSPCVTAPLAGALLYISTTGDALLGGAALFVLALGMGVPLLLIGAFGGHWLPKAGVWMERVKQVFGIMLLAVALWLTDRLLDTRLSLALWALLSIGAGLHLGALHRDSKGMAVVLQTLGIGLLFWGTLLLVGAAQGQGTVTQPLMGFQGGSESGSTERTEPGFEVVQTAEELDAALSSGEPVLLDFYADWCVSCVIMERTIFSQPEVQDMHADLQFVQLDMTAFDEEHRNILDEYGIVGPPAVLFFDANGEELTEARLVGEPSLDEFVNHMEGRVLPNI